MQIVTNIQADGAHAAAVPTDLLDCTVEQAIAPVDDIVAAAQVGSSAAFEELYSIYSRRLYQTIFSIARNPHDAEEALQDTFLRAYRSINTFGDKSKIYTWLTRIAVNSTLMILRKRKTRSEVSFDASSDNGGDPIAIEVKDSAPNPEELCDLHQRQHRTWRAIHGLSPHLRAPIKMQMMRGCSIREIGQALNISEAAVKSRLYRARQQLSASRGDCGNAPSATRSIKPTRIDR
jgi:RNA polymerase sigma-70 factor (ECF subfamily)